MCDPGVEVSTGAPDAWPFWSTHEEIPGPPAASVQLKLESTTWPSEYTAPLAGVAIVALGAEALGAGAPVYVSVTWAPPVGVSMLHPPALQ
jgi:hypothetical protein